MVRATLDLRKQVNSCPECAQRFGVDATFCPFDGSKLETVRVEPLVDPLLGTTIDGRYEIRRPLGEGGMGVVYEVRHKMLDRSFAMKLLRRDVARDPGLTERFIHEAKATASIKHPHIVSITDFGQLADGTPYFIMELLLGRTLAQLIRAQGPLSIERAYPVLIQAASALGAAHEAGIVHRDLKPENVFLARRPGTDLLDGAEDVKVVDFGAAKVLGSSRVTKAGIVFGTPHYMSPEQASGQPVDHRADIYALGVIMYEMLTGHVPFEADSYMGVLTQHMFIQPTPPSRSRPELALHPGGLEDITLRALEKKPEDRYQTMNDVRADLERAASGGAFQSSRRPSALRGAQDEPWDRPPEGGVLLPLPRRALVFAGIGVGMGVAALVSLSWSRLPGRTPSPVSALLASPRARVADLCPEPPSPPSATAAFAVTLLPRSSAPLDAAPVAPAASMQGHEKQGQESAGASGRERGAPGAPTVRVPAPRRSSSHHSTIPGELSDPWAQ